MLHTNILISAYQHLPLGRYKIAANLAIFPKSHKLF